MKVFMQDYTCGNDISPKVFDIMKHVVLTVSDAVP